MVYVFVHLLSPFRGEEICVNIALETVMPFLNPVQRVTPSFLFIYHRLFVQITHSERRRSSRTRHDSQAFDVKLSNVGVQRHYYDVKWNSVENIRRSAAVLPFFNRIQRLNFASLNSSRPFVKITWNRYRTTEMLTHRIPFFHGVHVFECRNLNSENFCITSSHRNRSGGEVAMMLLFHFQHQRTSCLFC